MRARGRNGRVRSDGSQQLAVVHLINGIVHHLGRNLQLRADQRSDESAAKLQPKLVL
jgi:hypothetical protein